jgi:putative flippase GtrA
MKINELSFLFKGKTDKTFLQLFRYTFVGGFAFIVDFALLYVLTDYLYIHYLTSAAISFIAGLVVNYILSKIWVFNKSSYKNRWVEFLVFALIGIVGLLFTEILMWFFTSALSIYYILSKIATTVIVYLWNFFARKIIIF